MDREVRLVTCIMGGPKIPLILLLINQDSYMTAFIEKLAKLVSMAVRIRLALPLWIFCGDACLHLSLPRDRHEAPYNQGSRYR